MHEHPSGTLPDTFHDPASLRGYYRWPNEPDVTHAAVVRSAAERTWQRMRDEAGVVLVRHDTTVGDYSGLGIDELGQIGDGHGRGLYIHHALAVTPDRRVLGLAGQLLHKRRRVPRNETKSQRRAAPDRESRSWQAAVQQLPAAPPGRQWIDVADRGADVTEFLAHEHRAGRAYVVRPRHNRKVQLDTGTGGAESARLHAHIRAHTPMARTSRAQEVQGTGARAPRTARLAVAWAPLRIVPPRQARGDHDGTPLPVWAVRVWECEAPTGEKPIEWVLLTNAPVGTEADAWDRVDWYGGRWVVEEYHKAQKTGVRIEAPQFTTRGALDVTIGLRSVVAVSLLELRELARDPRRAAEPATHHVPRLWVVVLSSWRHAQVRETGTVREFVMALARLGGHQNRKHDAPPGWIVLWRGWAQLQAMLQGAAAVARE